VLASGREIINKQWVRTIRRAGARTPLASRLGRHIQYFFQLRGDCVGLARWHTKANRKIWIERTYPSNVAEQGVGRADSARRRLSFRCEAVAKLGHVSQLSAFCILGKGCSSQERGVLGASCGKTEEASASCQRGSREIPGTPAHRARLNERKGDVTKTTGSLMEEYALSVRRRIINADEREFNRSTPQRASALLDCDPRNPLQPALWRYPSRPWGSSNCYSCLARGKYTENPAWA
jgi:hypothetical protein